MQYIDIINDLKINLFYPRPKIKTLLKDTQDIIYADWIGTGLPMPLVEQYLAQKVYPWYSNTHSNSFISLYVNRLIDDSKNYLKSVLNIKDDYILLFTGNGTTAAVNHLSNSISYNKYDKVVIFITRYEHYSNHLPWIEKNHSFKNVIIEKINLINYEFLDIDEFYNKLKYYNNLALKEKIMIIVSVNYCSNVTGYFLPINIIKSKLNEFNSFKKYLFVDYGCAAPYVNIDSSQYDAIFFSGHKFIGGISTPGILIGRKCLFTKDEPCFPGGGCVKSIDMDDNITYFDDLEIKESAGTPNIIGIIKLKKIFQIKTFFMNIIEKNEKYLMNLMYKKIKYFTNNYNNFEPIFFSIVKRLPIFSFNIKNIKYNDVVLILNDYFGIQCRGGISCSGLFGSLMNKQFKVDGWVRISFHWSMPLQDIHYIFDSVEDILKHGIKYFEKLNK